MPTVLLVRHGRTTANAGGILAGRAAGVRLDDVGREQAVLAAERVADCSSTWASRATRTHERALSAIVVGTARPFSGGCTKSIASGPKRVRVRSSVRRRSKASTAGSR